MSTGKDEFTTFAVKTQALTSFAGVLGAGGHSIDLSKSFKVTAHDYEQREPAGGTPVEVAEHAGRRVFIRDGLLNATDAVLGGVH